MTKALIEKIHIAFNRRRVTLQSMKKIPIELTEESHELLARHFKAGTELHEILERATRKETAGIAVYAFHCEPDEAEALLDMARNHCPPAVKDI